MDYSKSCVEQDIGSDCVEFELADDSSSTECLSDSDAGDSLESDDDERFVRTPSSLNYSPDDVSRQVGAKLADRWNMSVRQLFRAGRWSW